MSVAEVSNKRSTQEEKKTCDVTDDASNPRKERQLSEWERRAPSFLDSL